MDPADLVWLCDICEHPYTPPRAAEACCRETD